MVRSRFALIVLTHVLVSMVCLVFSFLLRFDFAVPPRVWTVLWQALPVALAVKMAVFYLVGLLRGYWRYASIADLWQILLGNIAASAITASVLLWAMPGFPRAVYLIDFLLTVLTTGGIRFAIRLYNEALVKEWKSTHGAAILIYGTGSQAAGLAREIRAGSARLEMAGFIDDDPEKKGLHIMGYPVLGRAEDIPEILPRCAERGIAVEQVIITGSYPGWRMREILTICENLSLSTKRLPSFEELMRERALNRQVRQVRIDDLLGRDKVDLDSSGISELVQGATVLVTGAAGSIGSELCRQVARFQPGKLILLDHAESDLFRIDLEMRNKFPDLAVVAAVETIRRRDRMDEIFRRYRPDLVLHAAAYKHVGILENNPLAAAANNIIGTWNVAESAREHGVKEFVLISTDKAVNPTSVMGASKRACEIMLTSLGASGQAGITRFNAVRFGNVLGSNGSVVQIFQKQIAEGGPVTVTHREVRRYFMTITEAAQLVLQAASMGKGSEIFVLDMGELIKIMDLAQHMIRLAGLVPGTDIEIRETGLKAGEKLYEEVMRDEERTLPTSHSKVLLFKAAPMDLADAMGWLDSLRGKLEAGDGEGVVALLSSLIPEYEVSSMWSGAIRSRPAAVQSRSYGL